MKKIYATIKGFVTGIVEKLKTHEKEVSAYPDAQAKGAKNQKKAEKLMENGEKKYWYAIYHNDTPYVFSDVNEFVEQRKSLPGCLCRKKLKSQAEAEAWIDEQRDRKENPLLYVIYCNGVAEIFTSKDEYKKRRKELPSCISRTRLKGQKAAEEWINEQKKYVAEKEAVKKGEVVIYTDGSFVEGIYGYGVAITDETSEYCIRGAGRSNLYLQYHSQGAELKAIERALLWLNEHEYDKATIWTDFIFFENFSNKKTDVSALVKFLLSNLEGKCDVSVQYLEDKKHPLYKRADKVSKEALKYLYKNNYFTFEMNI